MCFPILLFALLEFVTHVAYGVTAPAAAPVARVETLYEKR